jgi:hypothetical protein
MILDNAQIVSGKSSFTSRPYSLPSSGKLCAGKASRMPANCGIEWQRRRVRIVPAEE